MSGKDLDDFYGDDIEAEAVEPVQATDFKTRTIQFLTSPNGRKALILGAILCLGLLAIIVLVTLVIFWPVSTTTDTNNNYTQDNSTIIDDGCDSTYGYSTQIAHQWTYGIVVDLGSSGSRIGVYQWTATDIVQNAPSNGATYWYMEERPGVSSYAGDPNAAANSLIPLLEYAADRLECVKVNQSQVPIFLYATAGLRLLPDSQAQEILSAIRTLVTTQYSFRFDSPAWCRIISGTEEASFDWLSVQQLFLIHGNVDSSKKMANYKYAELDRVLREVLDYQSKGVVDLGGGSVEISFQPDQVDSPFDTDTFNSLNFNDTQYSVYGYSHLPYGHNEARKLVENALALAAPSGQPVANPCYLVGYNATVNTTSAGSVYFYGTGNTTECVAYIQQIMPKDECDFSACSFNGVYQPLVEDSSFMALDNMARIINFFALPLNPVLVELYDSSEEFCQTPWDLAQIEYVGRPLDSILLQNYCFEGLYGFELLTWGFGFPETSQQIIFIDDLYGATVSWALGAMVNQVYELRL